MLILAGFPYHESPEAFKWLWVYIMLPFLDEDSIHELIENHGKELRKLYRILLKYPHAFERLMFLLSFQLFFEALEKYHSAPNKTAKSRLKIKIIVDDTQTEEYAKCMEFIHRLFDHTKDRYIMGYNYVMILVVSGDEVFPMGLLLWLPKEHPAYKSKNDMVIDFINTLKETVEKRNYTLKGVEIIFDSAYNVDKLKKAARKAGLTVFSKAKNTQKYNFGEEDLYPKEIIEKVKNEQWNYLEKDTFYQRIDSHDSSGNPVVLIVRCRRLKNNKIIYDVLICTDTAYKAHQIHQRYKLRWEIELHFKYYKQYLLLGKNQFRKLASIRSRLYCIAIAGLLVVLFRRYHKNKISFKKTVKLITLELRN